MNKIFGRLALSIATAAMVGATLVVPVAADTTGRAPGGGGPVLQVSNPMPGDVLPRGTTQFFGVAYDPAAKTGTGVDRVSVYAGDRDAGGRWLGTATTKEDRFEGVSGLLGLPNAEAPRAQFAESGWRIKSKLLKRIHSGTLFFYARSSVSSQETVVKVENVRIDPGRKTGNP